jgi:hypothetical protein
MPLYHFKCECGKTAVALRPADKRGEPRVCACGKQMQRDPRGPSARIVETRDNGLMSRRVEQPADVERLMYERGHKDDDRGQ